MVTLVLAALGAVALYLLPVGLYVVVAGRRFPAPAVVRVLDVGIALALDAFVVLTLSRYVTLATATLVTRGVYAAAALAGVVALAVRPRDPTSPRSRVRVDLVLAVAVVVVAVLGLLHRCSYELVIWDREWHGPLTSSLRGHTLPFPNVYLPRGLLRYHYLGDVIAAMIQTLSFGVMSSALALTLAHDLFLCLTCGVLVMVLSGSGLRRAWLAPLLALPAVYAGPFVLAKMAPHDLLTTLDSAKLCGFTYLGFTTLAYRPHVVVAAFFIVLVAMVPILRTRADPPSVARTTASLVTSIAALSLLDEASVLMLLGGLGLAHQLAPDLLHPRRGRGIYLLAGLLGVFALVTRAFDGSLSASGQVQTLEIVPARHLQLFGEVIPFTDPRALGVFLADYLPQYAVVGLLGLVALRTRRRDLRAVWLLYTGTVLVSWFFAFKVEVNHAPSEGHRFITAVMVLAPVTAAYAIVAAPRVHLLRGLLTLVVAATTLSGLAWQRAFERELFGPPRGRLPQDSWAGRSNLMAADCREDIGPVRPPSPGVEYVEAEVFYAYAGCQPGLFVGRKSPWNITASGAVFGREARDMLERSGAADDVTAVVCSTHEGWSDPVCVWAQRSLPCVPLGRGAITRCAIGDAATRAQVVDRLAW